MLHILQNLVWGPALLLLLAVAGVYLTIILKGLQLRHLPRALLLAFWKGEEEDEAAKKDGDLSHFQALMTTLASAIGTGNIAGVATAVTMGGVGALFWMWVMAFLGMILRFGEALLAGKFRVVNEKGEIAGGPMYYLAGGMNLPRLALLFAVAGAIGALGTGNMVQVNSVADAFEGSFGVSRLLTGFIICGLTGIVLIGGVKSIGRVAEVLVPFMALFYLGGCLIVIVQHASVIPQAFTDILYSAFNGQAAVGAFAGVTVMRAVQMGFARAVFSSEAGLGISSIASASARSDHPTRHALVAMTGVFLSTMIVCSVTGLTLAVTGVLGEVDGAGKLLTGTNLVMKAFESLPFGSWIVTIGLILFAYSTILAWAFYGEKCVEYFAGVRGRMFYRIIFILLLFPSSILELEFVWSFADICNGLMAIPNLLALMLAGPIIKKETDDFFAMLAKTRESRREHYELKKNI